jgi:hypothetical protein
VVAAGGLADVGEMLVRGGAAIAALTAVAGGSVLVLRRLVDAIDAAPPPLLLAAVAAVSVLVLVADLGPRSGSGRVGPILARVGLVLTTLALAVPPAPTVASWIAAGISLLATAGVVFRHPRAVSLPALPALHRHRRPAEPPMPHPTVRPARRRIRRLPGSLRQRLTRYDLPDGVDCVRGRLTIAVPGAAKAAAGHIGFCPAFAETPEVEVTTEYDGVEVTVTAAEVLPWGVRVECRLAEPAEEPLEIPVDIVARAALVR